MQPRQQQRAGKAGDWGGWLPGSSRGLACNCPFAPQPQGEANTQAYP